MTFSQNMDNHSLNRERRVSNLILMHNFFYMHIILMNKSFLVKVRYDLITHSNLVSKVLFNSKFLRDIVGTRY